MRIFQKQLCRSPLFPAGLTVLLAAAVAFCSIGFSAWSGVQRQLVSIETQYHSAAYVYSMDGPLYYLSPELLDAIRSAPVPAVLDQRELLLGVAEGFTCLTSRTYDSLAYSSQLDTPYTQAVFAVRCDSVEDITESSLPCYIYTCTVLGTLCRGPHNEDFPDPTEIEVGSTLADEQTLAPVMEAGKTYLIRGRYSDYQVGQTITTITQEMIDAGDGHGLTSPGLLVTKEIQTDFVPLLNPGTGSGSLNGDNGFARVSTEDGRQYDVVLPGMKPLVTEYTGSWQSWLASDQGAVWREEVIPDVRLNYSVVKVMLTDSLYSIYAFNAGNAYLTEGRAFTAEEYAAGAPVCLVSSDYARLNGLRLGDRLPLDLYAPGLSAMASFNSFEELGDDQTFLISSCSADNRIGVQQDYTIVGIYSGAAFASGTFAFSPDTVLVPKNSVPAEKIIDGYPANDGSSFARISGETMPALFSLQLPNGTAGQLEAYLESQGFGGQLLYLDQGYTEAAASLAALDGNARRLLVAGAAVFLLAGALFLFLLVRRMAPAARSLRLLGMTRRGVWGQLLAALIPPLALAALAGGLLGAALYDSACTALLSQQILLEPVVLAQTAAVLLAALVLAALAAAWGLAARPLMRAGKKRGAAARLEGADRS